MDCIWSALGCIPDTARQIRTEVFVEEQGFQQEFDQVDQKSYHLLLCRNGRAIGTARLFSEDANRTMHIGRVAVRQEERHDGSGSAILEACCEKARQLHAERLILGAQCRAVHFYEKNGFHAFGDCYDDEGCPHQMMEKQL